MGAGPIGELPPPARYVPVLFLRNVGDYIFDKPNG